jgi:hypothetical protein
VGRGGRERVGRKGREIASVRIKEIRGCPPVRLGTFYPRRQPEETRSPHGWGPGRRFGTAVATAAGAQRRARADAIEGLTGRIVARACGAVRGARAWLASSRGRRGLRAWSYGFPSYASTHLPQTCPPPPPPSRRRVAARGDFHFSRPRIWPGP